MTGRDERGWVVYQDLARLVNRVVARGASETD